MMKRSLRANSFSDYSAMATMIAVSPFSSFPNADELELFNSPFAIPRPRLTVVKSVLEKRMLFFHILSSFVKLS